jgi:hypothetical protein
MAGRPRGTVARPVVVATRLSLKGADILDQMRGEVSRGDFLRALIATEAKRRGF